MNPTDYSVVQLREFLRARNLSVSGVKTDLIQRLEEYSPNVWTELRQRSIIEDPNERELELVRREAELRTHTPTTSARSPTINDGEISSTKGLKDLLCEFDGSRSEFRRWKQQVELLRDTYHLDDNATRVLISSRLKRKALNWFDSKPEYIVLSATNLLEEMGRMFDHRPSKLTLKKEFEQRMWQPGESFLEYYHDKIILANRIPIANDEIIDYVIDGVPNSRLRDQARLQRFQEANELIEAFEKITLKGSSKPE
ncbi:hypothetical protein DMN91_010392 [Ooceraea biroi]|uniref:SAP domain-containing protein n=1 Tax=Ooceraea biroi TaxID=2015173 RepID=A0A3L8DE27_OOCBI|nr:hypothetical protein DMN91_010392 [Ooceraea biroi]